MSDAWKAWQREHTAALEALQEAQRAYHRTIAGSAFASPTEGVSAIEMQKESLDDARSGAGAARRGPRAENRRREMSKLSQADVEQRMKTCPAGR